MKFTRKTATRVGAAVIAATALLGASPAFAKDVDSYINGAAHAWSHGKNGQVALKDTKGDSHSVYAHMSRVSSPMNMIRLDNTKGSGKTTRSDNKPSNPVAGIQACVDKQWAPDPCDLPRATERRK
ncbi:hypothetical protein [Streptomyces rimosus]|uniref:hypothetical protein n=1 Tax=Streptomyces rimosus TaxID=1927 RepID=UPI0037BC1B23